MNLKDIPFGTPQQFNVLIEIPSGSANKYEVDEQHGFLTLEYVYKDGLRFPFNYGFVPNTRAGDNDPLDAVVMSNLPIYPMTVVMVKAVAILKLKDRGEQDDKLITVPVIDPLAQTLHDLTDLSQEQKEEIIEFFKQVGIQKSKSMEIEDFYDKNEAMAEVKRCLLA